MPEFFENNEMEERVILVGVSSQDGDDTEDSLDELEELVKTAGAVTVGRVIQNRQTIHPGLYIGSGKVEELLDEIPWTNATGIVCDDELSPAQLRNLSDALNVKVMDRTLIILDIFAARASTSEGKIQVELAQLRYRMSRLSGIGKSMSRLGGGIGTRGPGEKKLEVDRRLIASRISQLKRELEEVKRHREVNRVARQRNHVPVAAIVGYTNAGKSTLLNALTGAGILAEDKLFATLDPTTRMLELPGSQKLLLTDTVGFIRKLPHHLIDAFRSTLEEAIHADLLLQVVDVSDPYYREHMRVTQETLNDLGAGDIPMIIVYNKADRVPQFADELPLVTGNHIHMAAGIGVGIDALAGLILSQLFGQPVTMQLLIPYNEGSLVHAISEIGDVKKTEYQNDGTYMQVVFTPSAKDQALLQQLESYRI